MSRLLLCLLVACSTRSVAAPPDARYAACLFRAGYSRLVLTREDASSCTTMTLTGPEGGAGLDIDAPGWTVAGATRAEGACDGAVGGRPALEGHGTLTSTGPLVWNVDATLAFDDGNVAFVAEHLVDGCLAR